MHTIKFLLSAATVAWIGGLVPAVAQIDPVASNASEQVIVTAPHTTAKLIGQERVGRLPVYRASLSRPVSYADLDLTRVSDRRVLAVRIQDTATDICRQIERDYLASDFQPIDNHDDCVSNAISDARAQMAQIASAQ